MSTRPDRDAQDPLTLLAGPERLESGWWSLLSAAETEGEELALRDYYVARSPHAGLLWVYGAAVRGSRLGFCRGFMAELGVVSLPEAAKHYW